MEYFAEWKEIYNTGIEHIDAQHKKLFQLSNILNDSMISGKSYDIIEEIFLELIDYTEKHFEEEEELMFNNQYPDISHHTNIHKYLKQQLNDFYEQFKTGKLLLAPIKIRDFLKTWILNHIIGTDTDYINYIK